MYEFHLHCKATLLPGSKIYMNPFVYREMVPSEQWARVRVTCCAPHLPTASSLGDSCQHTELPCSFVCLSRAWCGCQTLGSSPSCASGSCVYCKKPVDTGVMAELGLPFTWSCSGWVGRAMSGGGPQKQGHGCHICPAGLRRCVEEGSALGAEGMRVLKKSRVGGMFLNSVP